MSCTERGINHRLNVTGSYSVHNYRMTAISGCPRDGLSSNIEICSLITRTVTVSAVLANHSRPRTASVKSIMLRENSPIFRSDERYRSVLAIFKTNVDY
jgi:hypothetical protein